MHLPSLFYVITLVHRAQVSVTTTCCPRQSRRNR